MFDNEIETILGQYKESTKLVNKLKSIYAPYEYSGPKRNQIFYLDIRIDSIESVKNHAFNSLNNLLKYRELRYPDGIKQEYDKPEELAKIIKKLDIQDFFNSLTYYIAYRKKEYTFLKNRYQETQSYSRRNCLILECIQLLKTGETLSNDLRYKIDRIDAGTFIFCDCKVQTFKNGKIIIDFANPELFAEFKKRYEAGVKLAEKQYKTYV